MLRNIIVGYDGRDHARDALALGKLLADTTGATLTVAGVVTMPVWRGPLLPVPDSEIQEFTSQVEEAAKSVGAGSDIIEATSAAHGLHMLAEETEADLVVVGSAQDGRLGGTTGRALLHAGPSAVAVAPAGYRDRMPGLQVLGVGIDGNEEAKEALRTAVELAKAAHARIRLLAAADAPPTGPGRYGNIDITGILREEFTKYMDDAVQLVPEELREESRLVSGIGAKGLVAEEGIDLLCVGSRGYGPVRRVLLGSTSAELIESAKCPVLVVPRSAGKPASATEAASAEAVQ